MSGCCKNELTLKKLCVEQICVDNIDIENALCSPELSSPKVCAQSVVAHDVNAQSACIASLNAPDICSNNINASNMGVSNLVANNACIPGDLRVANLLNCGKYRATVTFGANTLYTLGTPIDWSVILDDPNGNVSLGPTLYTAPLTGYYLVTLQIIQENLLPASGSPILGTPVALVELLVNGVHARQAYVPYLSFVGSQSSLLTSMISLNAGDSISSDLKVLIVDPILGLVPVVGTVIIDADGSNSMSLMSIHLMSITCNNIPCAPSVPCTPCTPMTCVPCTPHTGTNPCMPCQL